VVLVLLPEGCDRWQQRPGPKTRVLSSPGVMLYLDAHLRVRSSALLVQRSPYNL
jgi:hypothetical protein